MSVVSAGSGIAVSDYDKVKEKNIKVETAHTMSFHCSKHTSISNNDAEHSIYDSCGKKRYEIQLYGPNNGKVHKQCLVNKYGQRVASLTVKSGASVFPLEVSTSSKTISGSYNPHIYRNSKATVVLGGITYRIIKSKFDGKKVYYWVVKGTDVPLIQMNKGFRGHDFTFFPKCPEDLEQAVILIRSYSCFLDGIYEN